MRSWRPAVLATLAASAALVLAGCGGGAVSGNRAAFSYGSTTSTSAVVSTTSTSLVGYPKSTVPPGTVVTPPTVAVTTPPSGRPTSTTATTTTTTTAPPVGRRGVLQLDASASGAYHVSMGQTIELTLATPGMSWGKVVAAPAGLLAPLPSPSPPANGQLAIWTAAARGTATVSSSAMAVCPAGKPCPLFVRSFGIDIVIS
jgi:hypothetical protein